jgi:hypothetical protein
VAGEPVGRGRPPYLSSGVASATPYRPPGMGWPKPPLGSNLMAGHPLWVCRPPSFFFFFFLPWVRLGVVRPPQIGRFGVAEATPRLNWVAGHPSFFFFFFFLILILIIFNFFSFKKLINILLYI